MIGNVVIYNDTALHTQSSAKNSVSAPAQNATLKAAWRRLTWTVTLDLQGGSADFPLVYDVPQSDSVDIPTTPTRDGYKFVGWDDGEDLYRDEDKDGKIVYTPTKDVTLRAIWQPLHDVTITETFTNRIDAWGAPSFIYHIDGQESVSGDTVHRTIIMTAETGTSVSKVIKDLPEGIYTVRRIDNMRYKPASMTQNVTIDNTHKTIDTTVPSGNSHCSVK